ncbi:uncharacterized protein LOC131160930 [Malania oleifera]|uniref:uncharacterized protein LOC131160930 n=1 Tax=Malania oleifera TaxID=397392 RepID=UPI0025ADF65E|nr:uncharacterized protein LOC131160930 [Malania oleifera]
MSLMGSRVARKSSSCRILEAKISRGLYLPGFGELPSLRSGVQTSFFRSFSPGSNFHKGSDLISDPNLCFAFTFVRHFGCRDIQSSRKNMVHHHHHHHHHQQVQHHHHQGRDGPYDDGLLPCYCCPCLLVSSFFRGIGRCLFAACFPLMQCFGWDDWRHHHHHHKHVY